MDGFEKYVRNKERKRNFTDYWVDIDAGIACTSLVWSGIIEPENITLIDEQDAEWLNNLGGNE